MRLRGGGRRGQKDGLPHGGGIWLRHAEDAGRLRRARRCCHARGALAQHGEPRAARLQAADRGARAHTHESVRAGGRRRLLRRPQGRRNRQAVSRCRTGSAHKGETRQSGCHLMLQFGDSEVPTPERANRARTVSFINAALNRMLLEEKPCRIVITHPVKVGKGGNLAKTAQRKLARSFRGFIRERLGDSFQGDRAYLFSLRSDGTNNRRQPLQVPALWL